MKIIAIIAKGFLYVQKADSLFIFFLISWCYPLKYMYIWFYRFKGRLQLDTCAFFLIKHLFYTTTLESKNFLKKVLDYLWYLLIDILFEKYFLPHSPILICLTANNLYEKFSSVKKPLIVFLDFVSTYIYSYGIIKIIGCLISFLIQSEMQFNNIR